MAINTQATQRDQGQIFTTFGRAPEAQTPTSGSKTGNFGSYSQERTWYLFVEFWFQTPTFFMIE